MFISNFVLVNKIIQCILNDLLPVSLIKYIELRIIIRETNYHHNSTFLVTCSFPGWSGKNYNLL